MKTEQMMSEEDLKQLPEESIVVEKRAFNVNGGMCKECNAKLVKVIEDRAVLDGAATFHITKLKCPTCRRLYLDLDNAEKYDLLLMLEKATKEKPLVLMAKKMEA